MKNLNLDNEHFPMVEDDAHHDCQLCKYNIDFLDSHLELLAGKTSKSNMYKILFEIFEKRNTLMKTYNFEHVDVSFEEFVQHMENHQLNARRVVTEDIRLVKSMQQKLLETMQSKSGLNATSVNTWMRLSAHKISLISRLKPLPKQTIISNGNKPHEFS